MTARELAERAAEELMNGGFTLDLDGDAPTEGFAVAVYPEAEEVIEAPTVQLIVEYIVRWAPTLIRDPRARLGGWVSEGKLYLDISAVYHDRDEALKVARANKQKAIYDLGAGAEIAA